MSADDPNRVRLEREIETRAKVDPDFAEWLANYKKSNPTPTGLKVTLWIVGSVLGLLALGITTAIGLGIFRLIEALVS